MKITFKNHLSKHIFPSNKLALLYFATLFIIGIYFDASGSIEGSPHDLSTKQCGICHTDKSETGQNPLWEVQQGFKTFTIYNFKNTDISGSQQDRSLSSFCLGCHNGIFSKFIKNREPGLTSDMDYDESFDDLPNNENNPWDNHPVHFIYNPRNDVDNNNFPKAVSMPGKLNNKAIHGKDTGTYYPLYGTNQDQFECKTCHVAHDPVDQPIMGKNQNHLLRADNKNSSMCRDCHRNKYSGKIYNAFR
jgi:hypothetical protein